MNSPYFFIVSPKSNRYNNVKNIENKNLILNTDISNYKFISKKAIVKHVPSVYEHDIKVGDELITHHNIFRRWYNMKGEEKNSRSYISENTYFLSLDQIYLYRSSTNSKWKCLKGYCFIKPLKSQENITIDKEQPLIGVVKYTDGTVKEGDLVGFSPGDEFEFIIDGEKLYAVMSQFISIKYEYQGNEKEYNPSWA